MSARTRLIIAALALGCIAAGSWGIASITRSSAGTLSAHTVRWEFAALSVVAMIGFALVYAVCWSTLACALGGDAVRRGPAMRLFLLTWPGRYLPASVAHYGGRFVAGPSIGAGRGAIAASFVYENLLTIAGAGAVAMLLLLLHLRSALAGGAWAAAAISVSAFAIVSLHPAVSRTCIRIAARRVRRLAPLERHILGVDVLLRVFAGYAFGAMLAGLAFFAALLALGEDVSPATAIAAYNLAGIAGMLALFVPGGVGVREGVVVALLSGVVSPPVALAAALLARLASIAADLIPAGVILLAEAVRRLSRTRAQRVEPAPAMREAA